MSLRTNVSYFGGLVLRICRAVSTFNFTSNQGSNHILGYVTKVRFNELTDSVILICCCFHLFTHYIWLLIRWSRVRDPTDQPLFTNNFSKLSGVTQIHSTSKIVRTIAYKHTDYLQIERRDKENFEGCDPFNIRNYAFIITCEFVCLIVLISYLK